jgi:DNA-binding NarL/FixJ family response regulator
LAPVFTEEEWGKLTKDIQLPPRQRQIAYFLMCGLSDRQIAMKLELARPTVRTHFLRPAAVTICNSRS